MKSPTAFQAVLVKTGSITLILGGCLLVTRFFLKSFPLLHNGLSFLLAGFLSCGLGCLILAGILALQQRKWLVKAIALFFICINCLAYVGAYALTHSVTAGQWGIGSPKAISRKSPEAVGLAYTTQRIPMGQNDWLETWIIPQDAPRGSVLLFPGSGGTKGEQLLAPAKIFHELGYTCVLVDFRGVGGSSGNTRTLGALEAKDVAVAVNDTKQRMGAPIILYGISMGSAAILRAIAQEKVEVDSLILELPYDRLINAIRKRFSVFKLPAFPVAELLLFWGSVQHGFNGFAHNPIDFAKTVHSPTLILQGAKDRWIKLQEVRDIYQQLRGEKELVIFSNAGHHVLATVDQKLWKSRVDSFLGKND
jgi:uncharacterized protein